MSHPRPARLPRQLSRRSFLAASAAGALIGGAAVPSSAVAQAAEFPKPGAPIRYVVPFPPGGLTDVMARQVGQALGERLKAQVVVENKPGGGAQIGAAEVAKSAGDGHTLLAITMAHAVNATLYKGRASYDFQKDLRPVALLAGSPMLVVVPTASPVKDFRDLIARAKTGQKLNAGSSGNGTPPHLTLALFNDLHKTDIQHVPYKGGAPSLTDLIGGQLDVILSNFPESIAHVKGGKLRALAVTGPSRHPQLPDVPTTTELGTPQMALENWTALMVPASTPDAVVNRLGAELLQIMATPAMQERATGQGFRVDARGPQAFATFLNNEVERWGRVVVAAKVTVD
jgi:tripartite-type tricarboxylate transporter receptor subunit TctC